MLRGVQSINDITRFSTKDFVGPGNDCETTVRQCVQNKGSGAVVDLCRKIWKDPQINSNSHTNEKTKQGANPREPTPVLFKRACLRKPPLVDGLKTGGDQRQGAPVENDWRFAGVLGQASRQPRPDIRAGRMEDRLERVVDVMERSLANLNERMTAVELDSDRAGRTQSSRMATERPEVRKPRRGSAAERSCRPEAPRRRTVGTTPMPSDVDRHGRATERLGRRPARTDEYTSEGEEDADLTRRRRTQGHHHARPEP